MKRSFLKFLPTNYQLLTTSAIALFVYMPFHIFLSQWLSTFTGGLDGWKIAKDVFTALLAILCIATVVWSRKYTKLYLYLLGGTLLYGLIHLILLFTTNQPFDTGFLAVTYNLRLFAYVLIGYSIALLLPTNYQLLTTKFARILLILSTVVCLFALFQTLLPRDLMTHFGYSIERGVKPNFFIDDKPDLPRVFSTLRDPNSLGAFLILPIILLAQILIKNWKTNRRMLVSGLLLLHVWVLFLTFSRSTLLGTIAALAFGLALYNAKFIKKHATKIGLASLAAMLILGGGIFVLRDQYVVQNLVFHSDESTVLDDPNELRVGLVQQGIDGVIDEPLGHGPGTAGLVSTRLPNGLLTENYFLQIAYEVGIFGFTVFVGLLYLIISTLWKSRKDPIVRALLASFVGLVLANMLFHTWANEAVALSWFFLAGVALVTKQGIIGGQRK